MAWRFRAACFFGWHQWCYDHQDGEKASRRCCLRCGQVQDAITIRLWLSRCR